MAKKISLSEQSELAYAEPVIRRETRKEPGEEPLDRDYDRFEVASRLYSGHNLVEQGELARITSMPQGRKPCFVASRKSPARGSYEETPRFVGIGRVADRDAESSDEFIEDLVDHECQDNI